MARIYLTEARQRAGLSQEGLAARIGYERKTIFRMEKGQHRISQSVEQKIREILHNRDENLFENVKNVPMPCEVETTRDTVMSDDSGLFDTTESYKGLAIMDTFRRYLIKVIALLPVIPGSTDLTTSIPIVLAPEEALAQCNLAIGVCSEYRNTGKIAKSDALLDAHMPTLTQLVNVPNPHQKLAAGLMVQAQVMLVKRATSKLDYVGREMHCNEAVKFAKLSGNPFAIAVAKTWEADTFVYCYRLPQLAIPILDCALAGLSSEAQLNKSSICNKMAIAHAQMGDETTARDYIDQARVSMPDHPVLVPFSQCIGYGQAELDQFEGMMYLFLAEHFPNKGYAKMAYDLFSASTSKQAQAVGFRGQALNRKADAARAMGDMGEVVNAMNESLVIAIKIGSKKRFSEMHEVMQRVPQKWRKETEIQTLQGELIEASVNVGLITV